MPEPVTVAVSVTTRTPSPLAGVKAVPDAVNAEAPAVRTPGPLMISRTRPTELTTAFDDANTALPSTLVTPAPDAAELDGCKLGAPTEPEIATPATRATSRVTSAPVPWAGPSTTEPIDSITTGLLTSAPVAMYSTKPPGPDSVARLAAAP